MSQDLDFPLKNGQRAWASEKLRDRLVKVYGVSTVCFEFAKAQIWLEANPRQRPVCLDRFLARWMLKVPPPRCEREETKCRLGFKGSELRAG